MKAGGRPRRAELQRLCVRQPRPRDSQQQPPDTGGSSRVSGLIINPTSSSPSCTSSPSSGPYWFSLRVMRKAPPIVLPAGSVSACMFGLKRFKCGANPTFPSRKELLKPSRHRDWINFLHYQPSLLVAAVDIVSNAPGMQVHLREAEYLVVSSIFFVSQHLLKSPCGPSEKLVLVHIDA